MANPYFQFKQFTVFHDRCAMKVGTDGVLLGAWVNIENSQSALDIGTGTGLIALMMAQRNPTLQVDAIDIDADAIIQAKINCNQSPFAKRISIQQVDLQSYTDKTGNYDIIVSNPPFFSRALKSPDRQRTLARHNDSLSVSELISKASTLLSDKGKLSIIYPFEEKANILQNASNNNLYATRITTVYSTPDAQPKRILVELSKTHETLSENDLVIEIARHTYSDAFSSLVKDFYLKL